MAVRVCRCHGEPMDRDRSTNSGWRCAVKRREKQLRYWHKPDGGYIVARRRHLAEQRADILRRLGELREAVQ